MGSWRLNEVLSCSIAVYPFVTSFMCNPNKHNTYLTKLIGELHFLSWRPVYQSRDVMPLNLKLIMPKSGVQISYQYYGTLFLLVTSSSRKLFERSIRNTYTWKVYLILETSVWSRNFMTPYSSVHSLELPSVGNIGYSEWCLSAVTYSPRNLNIRAMYLWCH